LKIESDGQEKRKGISLWQGDPFKKESHTHTTPPEFWYGFTQITRKKGAPDVWGRKHDEVLGIYKRDMGGKKEKL